MKLQIIIGATRQGRGTDRYAKWLTSYVSQLEGVETELIDLKDYPMPFFDEPMSPRYNPNRQIDPQVKPWLDKIAEGDAYIFVTPEYNHSTSGVLKNAIDYLTSELYRKPVAVASHGSVGGTRAIMQLKEILSESQAAIIPQQIVFIGQVGSAFSEDGILLDQAIAANPYGPISAVTKTLSELTWYAQALKTAREQA